MLITAIFIRAADAYDSYKLKKTKFVEIEKAIKDENTLAVLQILKDVTFDSKKNDEILKAAILRDNVHLFNAVLDTIFKSDVNRMVSHGYDDDGPDISYGHGTRTILAYAIKNGCSAIALRLASDGKTDITKVGHTVYTEHYFAGVRGVNVGTTTKYDDSALVMARKASMADVMAVLSQRIVEMKREEVRKLESELFRVLPR